MIHWGIDGKGGTMARGSFGRYAELFGVVTSSENLDELPEASLGRKRASFFSRLMTSESLPFDEVSRGQPSSPSPGLLSAEALPLDDRPEPLGGGASFFATLFSRESLPFDPVQGPGRAGRDPGR